MFNVSLLPATFGDSFWITYEHRGKSYRILVDGGTAGTRSHIQNLILALPEGDRRIELVVVSHIDKDHISGILTMLQKSEIDVEIGDFWFNGRKHLPDDLLGAKHGEQLSEILKTAELPWNAAFAGGPVVIPQSGKLPKIRLPGGMTLTLLSPTAEALAKLADVWDYELRQAGLLLTDPSAADQDERVIDDDDGADFLSSQLPDVDSLAESDFVGDKSAANGSSIAFLAEFKGKKAIFAADAHATQILTALNTLSPSKRFKLDFFKLSHHGSKGTTSRELIEKVDCKRYAVTTNGAIFGHPNQETIARVLMSADQHVELLFNYKSKHNEIWGSTELQRKYQYSAVFGDSEGGGLDVEI